MKTFHKYIVIIAFMIFSMASPAQEQNPQATYVENEFIIWLEPGVDASNFAIESNAGIIPKRMLSQRLNIWLFEIDDKAESHEAKMGRLWKNPDVRVIQNNHTNISLRESIPDDPYYGQQWAPAIMQLPQAWETYTTGGVTATGDTIVVAVIDGGVYLNHEDLSLWKNSLEIPNNGIDDDNNGYVDDYDGWNAYNHNGNVTSNDHGTHVAGIIGAVGNNGIGVCGVNWNVKVLPVCGSSGNESIVVEAYSYVLEMRARYNETNGAEGAFVVATNSSFGVDYGNPDNYPIWCAMYDEMGNVGILSCGAGPNLNVNVDEVGDVPSTCPGDYLIGVTNTTSADVKNSSAGYGINNIDIGAPGTTIYSTVPNGYGNKTGTSMATPQVAGTIALMYAAMPEEMMLVCKTDPAAFSLSVRESLFEGADYLASLEGLVADARRLNAYGAIESMLGEPIVPVLAGDIKIDGEPVSGETLTVVMDLSSIPPIADLGELSYQWWRDTIQVEGAVDPSYTLTDEDVGSWISVQVAAANCLGTITSQPVGPVRLYDRITGNAPTSLRVYPNPTKGLVTVEGTGHMTVMNTLGQTIRELDIDGQAMMELPKGIYFIQLNGTVKKVVVE